MIYKLVSHFYICPCVLLFGLTADFIPITVESQVLTCITNRIQINFLSKGYSTLGPKNPFISNLKKLAFASKWDVLDLATLQYI